MDLARTQFLSLVTKAITTALGIIQSIIYIRLLTAAEFGIVGLVMSIGGLIGVSQHLGIVDGAIREIAVLKKKEEIGKVFWVSHITRQLVTIPLSLLLVLLAGYIANHFYNRPEIIPYIQLYAAVLILQGLQDVLGATLTGMKSFVSLYVTQIVTAVINIAVFGYFTWRWGISGFFWAIIVTTFIMVVLLAMIIVRDLRGHLTLPTIEDMRKYGRRVMRIGAYMYLSRIFFVVWQRLPILILGGVLTAEKLGYLNVSMTFGSRLTIIAMALSEVNMAWMSSLFSEQRAEFQKVVIHNMQRVLVLMIGITLILLFFTPEILLIIGRQYFPAERLILIMTVAFFLYALTDIGTSSVFVPANRPRLRTWAYGLMVLVTGGVIAWLFKTRPDPFLASVGVLAGALVGYVSMIVLARWQLNINLLTPQLMVFLVALGASLLWLFEQPALLWRVIIFVLLVGYILYEAHRSELLPPLTKIRSSLRRA